VPSRFRWRGAALIICATTMAASAASDVPLAGDAQPEAGAASPSPTPKPKLTVLHRHATADGRVVAYWMGIDPRAEEPEAYLPFSTEELWFEFREPGAARGRRIRYRPKGELFFSDWYFDVFSSDEEVVVLKEDHYGPFDVVWTRDLERYLRGRKPAEVTRPVDRGDPGAVHMFLGWQSKRAFEFRQSCCASERDCLHTIGSGRTSACGPYRDATDH
jgi:hypothetical protein